MAFDGPDGYAVGLEALARAIEPRRPLLVSDWAARYRTLPSKTSAEYGRWRNERVPFAVDIMNALDPRHPAPIVVYVGSSQIVKSEIGLNWIGRTVHQAPASFLALFPSEKVARKWVRTRLDSMIALTPELRALMPLGRRANSGNTLSEKHYPGGVLFTGSANIPDDVASISVPNLLYEEVDRMPQELEGEGDPLELGFRRSATFSRSKAFLNSTPTVLELSRIWPYWLRSTMDRFYVPCVHCNHTQVLRWAQLKWTPGKPETAGYVCESCSAVIEERHKTEMLAAGEWRPEHPEREDEVKGFHLNGLYTPIGLGDKWAKHAEAFERAQGSQARLQVFYNTRLGEAHKGERIRVAWEEVKRRAEPYKLREPPAGVLLLTSGTDVQADRLETQILGHGRGEQITVIDYQVHYGDTTRPATEPGSPWAALDEYLGRPIRNSYGVDMRLSCSLVDAGYLPDTVMGFTRPRKARGIYASRGSTIASKQAIGRPSYPDVKRRGKTDARSGAERYEIGVSVLKHWLFELLRSDEGDPDAGPGEAETLPPRHIRFSTDLPDEYYKQLTAETFDPKHGWIERANYHRNEVLDNFLLGRAGAMHHSVNLHRMRELDFERLTALYEPEGGARVAAPDELGKTAIPRLGGFLPTSAKTTKD